jgi:2-dehydro-3-deoxyphosphogluconate aldolase/(4S)-4-hydroxy-2-oxoglutarate aldolase
MVINERNADFYIQAGVSYISSPCFIVSVSDECYQNKIPYVPGCMTIREVYEALQAGCEIIQISPGEVTGVSFATAVKSVFPGVKLLVSAAKLQPENSFQNWFAAGASTISIRPSIIKYELMDNNEYDQLENEMRKLLEKLR